MSRNQADLAKKILKAGGTIVSSHEELLETLERQPMPTESSHPASWDTVIRDLEKGYSGPAIDVVFADIVNRDLTGLRKYGTRLKPHNGRDSLLDAYEEALDLTVYLKNAHSEGAPVYMLYREALRMAISIREIMLKRDGR